MIRKSRRPRDQFVVARSASGQAKLLHIIADNDWTDCGRQFTLWPSRVIINHLPHQFSHMTCRSCMRIRSARTRSPR